MNQLAETLGIRTASLYRHVSGLNETEKRHWQRILRSYMSVFIEQEDAGYFRYYSEDREETYRLGIECYIDGLVHRKKGGA